MADNVLLLGAGFSFDAGIPLMGNFVERMWHLARKGKNPVNGEPLADSDRKLLIEATELMNELDSYHGRANFDDRNIEDLLSILSFRALAGGKGSRSALDRMTQSIARTIELTCQVKGRDLLKRPNSAKQESAELYRKFWRSLFTLVRAGHRFPTIITFNYDLVLERSLLEQLVGTEYNPYEESKRLPFRSVRVNYHNRGSACPTLTLKESSFNTENFGRAHGYRVEAGADEPQYEITLLKLHGSLNFAKSAREQVDLERPADDPQILPPLFNKDTAALGSSMWGQALKELSEAKNVVVVGYSLPQTDIYMQYFLRAALGPNMDLNRITVYDPVLYEGGDAGAGLRKRYQDCFSSQLQRRINFSPASPTSGIRPGTTRHFVEHLSGSAAELLFL